MPKIGGILDTSVWFYDPDPPKDFPGQTKEEKLFVTSVFYILRHLIWCDCFYIGECVIYIQETLMYSEFYML